MIRRLCCLTLLFVVALRGICIAVADQPKEGVWYCEELSISIDFSEYNEERKPDIAKFYFDDGSYIDIECYFDYGQGISFYHPEEERYLLTGEYKYEEEEKLFYVISNEDEDEYEYIFERVDVDEDEGVDIEE